MAKCSVTWCERPVKPGGKGFCNACYLYQLRHGTTERAPRELPRGQCTAGDCTDTVYVVKHGLCKLHYSRFVTKGDPLAEVPRKRIVGDDVSRFWSYVDKNGPVPSHRPQLGRCWAWTGSAAKGRGYIGIGDATVRATRYLMGVIEGNDITGLDVLHHCDNPNCVNPAHLFIGTHLDNMRDMDSKGRRVNASTKLTPEFVRAIRVLHAESGSTIAELARALQVNYITLFDVINRRTWKNV